MCLEIKDPQLVSRCNSERTSNVAGEMAARLRRLEVDDGALQIEIHDVARCLEMLSEHLDRARHVRSCLPLSDNRRLKLV